MFRWNCRTTHWVAPKLNRTAKALSAMAAGAWLLSTSFITASAAARALVEPVSSCPVHSHWYTCCRSPSSALQRVVYLLASDKAHYPLIKSFMCWRFSTRY